MEGTTSRRGFWIWRRDNRSARYTAQNSPISSRDLLLYNLALQVFDGLLSYQVYLVGAAEANPFVAAAMNSWGVTAGLLYNKTLACVLLLLVFGLRHRQQFLTTKALTVTAWVYSCVAAASIWELLR